MDRDRPTSIMGIDLAWGEKNPDGVTVLRFPDGLHSANVTTSCDLVSGDSALLEKVNCETSGQIFLAIDAPTLAVNRTGSRPVDRECSRLFRKEEAGCHPVNRTLCSRPFRVAETLSNAGFVLSADLAKGPKLAAEVYPHPAMIRFFGLEKTIKYKKGPVENRRREFMRYQQCFQNFLRAEFPLLAQSETFRGLISCPWTKNHEDQLDSFLCAVIGWWHLRYQGRQSQLLGDETTGQMLIPVCPEKPS